MASCITEQWDGRSAPQLRLTVTNSETETQAKLSWKLEYVASSSYAASTGSARSYKAVIDGSTVASGTYDINGLKGTHTIKSGTKTITKGTTSKAVSFSCSMDFNLTWSGNYAGTKSASGSISISKKTSYSITYNANNGSGAPNSQTKWYGTDITLSSTKPTRTGYTFLGWATSSSSTTVAYNPGDKYTSNAKLSLYAVWTALKYTISFNANGGSGAPSGQQKTYGKDLTLTNKTPTRTNYTFLGWGVSSSSTTVSYKPGGTYSKNAAITLYAIWSLSYTKPRITNTKAYRCNTDGKASDSGNCIMVKFSWQCDKDVTGLKVQYKLASASEWENTIELSLPDSETDDMKSGKATQIIGDGTDAWSFDTDKAYKIDILVSDSGGYSYHIRNVNAMVYPIDVLAGGKGVAFGKPSSTEKFDVAYATNFDKDLVSQGDVYAKGNNKCFTKADTIPISCGGTGEITAEEAAKALGYGRVLWSGGSWMTSSHTASLSQSVSEQPHGIILSFSEYKDSSVQDYGWTHFFVSKRFVKLKPELGSSFIMATGGFEAIGVKYLYIFDTKITGYDMNSKTGTTSGISYQNNRFMLRYVIGV